MAFTRDQIKLSLPDGRIVFTPLSHYPTLEAMTPKARGDWRYMGWGTGLEWPEADLLLSVRSIIHGWREHVPPADFLPGMQAALKRLGKSNKMPGRR